jgi:hypothetical protein
MTSFAQSRADGLAEQLITPWLSARFEPMDIPPPIYAEAEVPAYSLPALAERDTMIDDLGEYVYGGIPSFDFTQTESLVESGLLGGTEDVTREQWRVSLRSDAAEDGFDLVLFLPANAGKPVPVFVGLNFDGNHTVHPDPAILLTDAWCRPSEERGVVDNRATDAGRGTRASRWPIGLITSRGYGLATVYCGDLAPDDAGRWTDGVAGFWSGTETELLPGAIATWAWGLLRVVDSLDRHPGVDPSRFAVIGHSRLGKTSLWAGALDERFALVISNESGCGGAALSRRRIGERLVHINSNFPHWFTPRFGEYNEREDALPIDQHQLLAAIAPRALYVASAEGDHWADPRGEYLALAAAAPQWGVELPAQAPAVGTSLSSGQLGYHCRPGEHDLTEEDWLRFLDFADNRLP